MQVYPGIGHILHALNSFFPANDTMLDHVILEDETLSDDRSYSNNDEKKDDARVEEAMVTYLFVFRTSLRNIVRVSFECHCQAH